LEPSIDLVRLFPGDSRMAVELRTRDWAETPLGPPQDWPPVLRAALRIMLSSRSQMWVGWGPDILFFYNDAYAPTLGLRRDGALARPTRELWAEIWHEIEPRVQAVYGRGQSTWDESLQLIVERNGYPEETYHTFSYSPLFLDDGSVGGLFCSVTEETGRIISDRRLESLRAMSAALSRAAKRHQLIESICTGLSHNPQDLVFSLLYLDEDGGGDRLACATGIETGHPLAPAALSGDDSPWRADGRFHIVDLTTVPGVPSGPWATPPSQACVLPLQLGSRAQRFGTLVAGLNPFQRIDERYRSFLKLLAEQITGALSRDAVAESDRQRLAALSESARLREAEAETRRELSLQIARATQSQVEARDRLQSLFEEAPGFMCVLRGDDFRFEFVNDAYQRLCGTWRTLVGRPIAEALPELDLGPTMKRLEQVRDTGQRFVGSRLSFALQRTRGAPLEERTVDVVYQPLFDADGTVSGVFAEGQDITEQLRAEAALRTLNADLEGQIRARTRERDLVWSAGRDLLLICSEDRSIVAANPAWTELLGFSSTDLVGSTLESVTHVSGGGTIEELFSNLTKHAAAGDVDLRLRARDGFYRWFSFSGVAADGQFYLAGRDITDRQQLEEQLRRAQRLESVGKLTGGVAHDFNNLLQVIGGNLQLLARHVAGNPDNEARLRNAQAGVARGAKLSSQLLAFARRQPLEPRVVNLGRFVATMDDMLRRALGEDVQLESVLAGGLWNVLVDPSQVENALLNLVINARDAMEAGGQLTVEVANTLLDDHYARHHDDVHAGQYVMLAVTDTGCGMASEVIERAFEPFYTTKPEGKGTGLGLSMVYGFVKQSGGHIKVYSELGQGTTIKIYLPRVHEDEDLLIDLQGETVRGGTETILVVEDDDAVRDVAVGLLTDLGYRVLRARDAASALNVIESGVRIDLLFTDVVMPGPLRSPDLARKARERQPNLQVLFTSGYTENAIAHGGRLDPGIDFLAKPYSRETLARKVRSVLAKAPPVVAPQAPQSAKEVPPIEPAGRRELVVLLVEDEPMVRVVTANMLEDMGHVVTVAGDATQALRKLEDTLYDVLFVDVGLPDLSGTELARRALADRPELRIIVASGRPVDLAAEQLPSAVMLAKPYRAEQLEAVLASWPN